MMMATAMAIKEVWVEPHAPCIVMTAWAINCA